MPSSQPTFGDHRRKREHLERRTANQPRTPPSESSHRREPLAAWQRNPRGHQTLGQPKQSHPDPAQDDDRGQPRNRRGSIELPDVAHEEITKFAHEVANLTMPEPPEPCTGRRRNHHHRDHPSRRAPADRPQRRHQRARAVPLGLIVLSVRRTARTSIGEGIRCTQIPRSASMPHARTSGCPELP
jgi:hypothetical protein